MVRRFLVPALVATGLAGCGSADEPPSTSPQATATPEENAGGGEVAIRDFKYVPDSATVAAGTRLVWTNEDAAPHTATADDGSFDTGDLRKGDRGRITLRKAGTYEYFCEFHRFMRGRVEVR